MSQQMIPLSQLKVSPGNVRKTGGVPIFQLANSILAHGLLQNLVVEPDGDTFKVDAGGLRLQALQKLLKEGKIPADFLVPCKVLQAGVSAHEASLAENVAREAMHPADEFDAFQRLITEDNLTPAEIAERFGTTERHVQQRLRLAKLAPAFLQLYRDGIATLEQLMALSVSDDAEAQLAAWGGDAGYNSYYRQPDRLREKLLEREITSDDGVVEFVGLDAYREAGGKVREDLFSDVVILLDGALVNRLAEAKLQAQADKLLAKGWGWVETRVGWSYDDRAKYKQSPGKESSALLGVIVNLATNGKVEVCTGLVKPGERAPKDSKTAGQPKHKSAKVDPLREVHEKLTGVRTGIVRTYLREDPEAALQVLVAALAKDFFSINEDHLTETLCSAGDIFPYIGSSERSAIAALDPLGVKESARWESLIKAGVKKLGSVLAWLRGEPGHVASDLMEFLAVEAVTPEEGYLSEQPARMHEAINLLGITLSDHWQLTAGWLQAQGKPYILAALEDALGKGKSEPFGKLKADALATQADKALREAGWLPEPMRAPAPKPKTPAKKAAQKTTPTKKASKK